jgi:hypothetical protein
LRCKFEIKKHAITAVGAPNSIGMLVKGIYWLYLIAKRQYLKVKIINYN